MELKPQEILDLLGLPADQITSLDDLRQKFEEQYAPLKSLTDPKSPQYQNLVPAFVGKVTGSTTSALKRKLKGYGLELEEEELKGKPLELVVETGLEKLHQQLQGKVATLEQQVTQSRDEATRELAEKYAKLEQKYKETDGLLSQARNQYETEAATWQQQLKGVKLEGLRTNKHETALKWRPDVKEVEREGFFATLAKRYKVDLDEQGTGLEVFDQDGKRIPSKAKAHTFKTYDEVLEETARELGVWNENPHGGQRTTAARFTVPAGAAAAAPGINTPPEGGRVRRMATRATK